LTSKFRSGRKPVSLGMFTFAIVWALFIAPQLMDSIVSLFADELRVLLALAFPGLMRSIMLVLWIMILVYPISYALEEIKIGQWEILLSNNVKTKDMLIGMFLGKIPNYGLMILILSPILLSPFIIVYEVSLLGQALMYGVLLIIALSTLWLSNVLSIAIQAKLGESSRGNDIAKALSIVVAIVFLLPLYGLMYFARPLSEIMGLDVFVLLPSTWGADLITRIALFHNGLGIPVNAFETILGLDILLNLILVASFAIAVIIVGFASADRLFSFESGARTEVVTTVGRENLFLRGIRRVFSGSFAALIVTSLKDFGRKAQNLSKVGYGIFLSILLPIMITYNVSGAVDDPLFLPILCTLMTSLMLGMIAAIAFGGVGFLEAKNQLWIIKGTPNGVSKFILARIISYLIIGIPIAMIPTALVSIIMQFELLAVVYMFVSVYIVVCGAILVGIGVTANNPAYEDTKSSAFYVNTFSAIFIVMFMLMFGFIVSMSLIFSIETLLLSIITINSPLLFTGMAIVLIASKRLSMPVTS
ncbi:MAG: hypothetical protein ACTSUB_00775, partial [Candidatus Thorarchaeota archaeon]